MIKILRVIGLILSVFCLLGSGFYFIEGGFSNLRDGNPIVSAITALFCIQAALSLYFIWNSRP